MTGLLAASTIHRMDAEITQLEQQLEQLIGLYEAGKSELRELRSRIVALEAENRGLTEKVRNATSSIEAILEKLPEA